MWLAMSLASLPMTITTDWHDATKRGRFETQQTTKLHWNGTAYVE